MKQPCEKDCPKRTAECKKTCPDWEKFEKEKFENYKLRDEYFREHTKKRYEP